MPGPLTNFLEHGTVTWVYVWGQTPGGKSEPFQTFTFLQAVLSRLKPHFLSRIEPLQTAACVCHICSFFLFFILPPRRSQAQVYLLGKAGGIGVLGACGRRRMLSPLPHAMCHDKEKQFQSTASGL